MLAETAERARGAPAFIGGGKEGEGEERDCGAGGPYWRYPFISRMLAGRIDLGQRVSYIH